MRSTKARRTFTETARRTQIVECAIETIAELGYPQASIRKIAERVGVAMSVVLYHFANKDELVEAIVEQMYRSALAEIVPAIEAESSAVGKLHAYIRAYLGYFDDQRTQQLALVEIGSNYRSRSGRRLDEMELNPEIRDQLSSTDPEAMFRKGQRNREFRALSPASTAIALRGALNSAVTERLRDPDFDVRGYSEDLVDMFDRITRRQ